MLDQLLAKLPVQPAGAAPAQDITPLLAMGEDVLASGDPTRAATIFAQIVEIAPDNAAAQAGLVRSLTTAGQLAEAGEVLAALDPALAADPAIAQARAALELAKDRPDDSELTGLRAAAAANPADMDTQLGFATAAFAAGERETAAETLLAMIAADRTWNEGAARAKLLQIFEATGLGLPPLAVSFLRFCSADPPQPPCRISASPSFRCRARSSTPDCSCRCTSSSRAIERW